MEDTTEFRTQLEQERERIAETIAHLHEENHRNMEDETGEVAGRGSDNHLGDMATVTFDRELDRYHKMLDACGVSPEAQANIFGGTLWRILNQK